MLKVNWKLVGPASKESLAWCHACGIIVYLGFPNTTAVSQEIDQSYYGGFKTGFYVSLALLVESSLEPASC
jgi:hypothetical protein